MIIRLGPLQITIGAVPAPAPRTVPNADATRLKEEDFIRIWKDITPEDEKYLAIRQLLARETIAVIDLASTPIQSQHAGAQAHANGQMFALIELANALEQARTEPERWTTKKKGTGIRGA